MRSSGTLCGLKDNRRACSLRLVEMRFDHSYLANELLCFLLPLFFTYLLHFLFALRFSSIYYFCTDALKKRLLAPRTVGLTSY